MSTILLQKSEENLISARLLIDGNSSFHNSSTQCSYYGCIQIIKHLLIRKFGSEAAIKEAFLYYKDAGAKGNSHAFYINTIYKKLRSDGHSRFAKSFNQIMFDLKILREDSAYLETLISPDQSKEAIIRATDIVSTLKSIYKLSIQ
jgi:hypothetical protein